MSQDLRDGLGWRAPGPGPRARQVPCLQGWRLGPHCGMQLQRQRAHLHACDLHPVQWHGKAALGPGPTVALERPGIRRSTKAKAANPCISKPQVTWANSLSSVKSQHSDTEALGGDPGVGEQKRADLGGGFPRRSMEQAVHTDGACSGYELRHVVHHRDLAGWRVEHDYREQKTGLGLDHFEGRSPLRGLGSSGPRRTV